MTKIGNVTEQTKSFEQFINEITEIIKSSKIHGCNIVLHNSHESKAFCFGPIIKSEFVIAADLILRHSDMEKETEQ